MFCLKCGAKAVEGAAFCAECGAPLMVTESQDQAVSPEATAVTPPAAGDYVVTEKPETSSAASVVEDATAFAPASPIPPTDPAASPTPVTPGQGDFASPAAYPPPLTDQASAEPAPPAAGYATTPMPIPGIAPPAEYQEKPKKSKKGLTIALSVVGGLLLVAAIAFFAYNAYITGQYNQAQAYFDAGDYQAAEDAFTALGDYEDSKSKSALAAKWLDYEAAQALYDTKDYEVARDAFDALGDFEDSEDMSALSTDYIDYLAGQKYFEDGDYESARPVFALLALDDFEDASEWVKKTDYAQAAVLFDGGDLYGAYLAFKKLGTYSDSADRMAACTTPFPANGTIYFDGGFASSTSELVIDGSSVTQASYFKLYSGDTLVSTFWVNPSGSVTLGLRSGTYTIKEAWGDPWFGEEIMFGDEGYYTIMTFDNDETSFSLEYNVRITITLATTNVTDANVGSEKTGRQGF